MYSCSTPYTYAVSSVSLCVRESQGRRYYYVDLGSESHGRKSFRLWVHHSLVQKSGKGEPVLKFPVLDAFLETTKKGNFVLRPRDGYVTHHVYVPEGYRGGSEFSITPSPCTRKDYYVYRSPRGSLGIGRGAIFTVAAEEHPVKISWKRWGRLYGAPSNGEFIIHSDGRVEEVPDAPEDIAEIP